jgi:hypothetical protein
MKISSIRERSVPKEGITIAVSETPVAYASRAFHDHHDKGREAIRGALVRQ